MSPLEEYIKAIEKGEVIVGYWVKEWYTKRIKPIVEGHDPEYEFDPDASANYFKFVDSFCVFTKNKNFIGKKMEYLLWQKAFFDCFYGIKRKSDGMRRFKEPVLIVATRNGKTEMAWPVPLFTIVTTPGVDGACAATKLSQSRILHDKCVQGIELCDALGQYFFDHKDYPPIRILTKKETGMNSKFIPLAKDQSKDKSGWDGQEFYFGFIDELHAATYDMYGTLKERMSNYDDGFLWCMGTAGKLRGSLFDERRVYYKKIILGLIENPTVMPVIYEIDSDDLSLIPESERPPVDDPFDERAWYKANPSLKVAKSLATMREDAVNARTDPNLKYTFLVKQLNCIGASASTWLPANYCINHTVLGDEERENLFKFATVIGGYDLSRSGDSSCFATLIFDVKNKRMYFKPMYWVTAEFLTSEKAKRAGVPWDAWIERGFVRVSGNTLIDYHDIANYINSEFKKYGFTYDKIGFDRYSAQYLTSEIASFGWPADGKNPVQIPVAQGFISLSTPMAEAASLLKEGRIIHDHNPVFEWNLCNVQMVEDRNGNMMPDKADGDQANKIDGFSVLLDCLYCYCQNKTLYTGGAF